MVAQVKIHQKESIFNRRRTGNYLALTINHNCVAIKN